MKTPSWLDAGLTFFCYGVNEMENGAVIVIRWIASGIRFMVANKFIAR